MECAFLICQKGCLVPAGSGWEILAMLIHKKRVDIFRIMNIM